MSDTFDHEGDAYASADYGCDYHLWGEPMSGKPRRPADPLYYHRKVEFIIIQRETPKAYLVMFKDCVLWLPKAICRCVQDSSMYVHSKTFVQIKAAALKLRPIDKPLA